ncbi:MAG: glycosyltransferase [Bacteroidales bacterium]|nr:glycosyltransferase [Bacteroidales bacterium]
MFSIIMPLYNKAPYVRKAVEGVLSQTCGDWELWVVDDGSTDGSADDLKAFSDPRVNLVRQANAGVSAARNRGVALSGEAEGASPYLCFLDADDWWDPTFLAEMAALVARHPEAGIYGTGYNIVKNGRKRVAPVGLADGYEGVVDYFGLYASTRCMPLCVGSVCIPRVVFNAAGGFDEGLSMSEDFDLWVRIAKCHKVVLMNKVLFNYNQDVEVRAMGSLPSPGCNFAFRGTSNAGHAPNVQRVVDMVRIICLRQYYISRRYHKQAVRALATIDMRPHRGEEYSSYVGRLACLLRAKENAYQIASRLWRRRW